LKFKNLVKVRKDLKKLETSLHEVHEKLENDSGRNEQHINCNKEELMTSIDIEIQSIGHSLKQDIKQLNESFVGEFEFIDKRLGQNVNSLNETIEQNEENTRKSLNNLSESLDNLSKSLKQNVNSINEKIEQINSDLTNKKNDLNKVKPFYIKMKKNFEKLRDPGIYD